MKLNILIGGKAGQGIGKISSIVSNILAKYGYSTFNYRDYQSLIRGGHNFNILTISDRQISSNGSKLDGIIALDDKTPELHKEKLKENGFIVSPESFEDLGRNLNVALAGALIKILGIDKEILTEEIKEQLGEEAVIAAEKGYESQKVRFNLERQEKDIKIMSGSQAIALGAENSGLDFYFAYPMTPATEVLNELAKSKKVKVFQPESEISTINIALGTSFTGKKAMVGTSGGGFDLMTEALSFQGQSEIPLVIYLATRPGPGTGLPTYTMQADLNVALGAGHGEFPRIVISPGDIIESIEKTNEAFYLTQKFNTVAILLSDKHLAENEFSFDKKPNEILKIEERTDTPGKKIIKKSSYEHDEEGNTIELGEIAVKNAEKRLEKEKQIKKEAEKFEMFKIHGKKDSKNLILGFGSTKGVILDSIEDLDVKFLQIIYLEPFSNQVKKEIEKADKVISIELNSTAQLAKLIKKQTGIEIQNKILKYDGRPFTNDELKNKIEELI